MASRSFSSRKVVEQLWEDVRLKEEARTTAIDELESPPALVHSLELAYLNAHWSDRSLREVPGGRSLPLSKRWIRARLAAFIVWFLDPYFQEERDFRAHVVRVCNDYARSQDRLATEVRVLREALVRESERLAQRDLLFHSLAEESRAQSTTGHDPK